MEHPRVPATPEQAQINVERQAEADFDLLWMSIIGNPELPPFCDLDLITSFAALRPQLRVLYRSLRVRHWQDTLTE
jgi:hypothetical protein